MNEFIVERGEAGVRLDVFLEDKLPQSRSQLKKEIDEKRILVNKKSVKAGHKVQEGDKIVWEEREPFTLQPREIPLEILYEDAHIAVIDKQPNLVVHPGAGEEEKTLAAGLLCRFNHLPVGEDPLRPGIVHRLDKDTSGLMVVALSEEALKRLIVSFKEREVKKTYLAIVEGEITEEDTIDNPIGRSHKDRKKMAIDVEPSKEAISHFRPIEVFGNQTLVTVDIETGRTHQIRVHLSSIHHPVVGDQIYGYRGKYKGRQLLHSYVLDFDHPITKEPLSFTSQFPKDMEEYIQKQNGKFYHIL